MDEIDKADIVINSDGTYASAHTVTFTETRWYERVRKFLPYLPEHDHLS